MGAVWVTTHLDSTVSTSGSSMASDLMGLMSKPYTSSQTGRTRQRKTTDKRDSQSQGWHEKGEDCKDARRTRIKFAGLHDRSEDRGFGD